MKKIGIWMDHANAFLMELNNGTILESMISSDFTHEEKKSSLDENEKMMHNKEQQLQASYYKKLGNKIIDYQEVVLFGPTDAKLELLNLIKANHLFDHIKIEVRNADTMTAPKMHEFVREYFK